MLIKKDGFLETVFDHLRNRSEAIAQVRFCPTFPPPRTNSNKHTQAFCVVWRTRCARSWLADFSRIFHQALLNRHAAVTVRRVASSLASVMFGALVRLRRGASRFSGRASTAWNARALRRNRICHALRPTARNAKCCWGKSWTIYCFALRSRRGVNSEIPE